MTASRGKRAGLIEVRATINLPGAAAGTVFWTDPSVPYIKAALASRYLVPTHRRS